MDREELLQRLLPVFLEEMHECVSDMQRHLQSLQQQPEPTVYEMLLNELYRAAHKIKGAANAAQVVEIEQVCRQMQDILNTVRDGQRTFDNELHERFVKAMDYLNESESRLRSGTALQSGAEIFNAA